MSDAIVVECSSEQPLAQYIKEHRADVVSNLETHGAILFHGWCVEGPDDFSQVAHLASPTATPLPRPS